MVGFLMVAFLGLSISAMAGLFPFIALRSFELRRVDDGVVALCGSLAAWSAIVMFGPAWAALMLGAGY